MKAKYIAITALLVTLASSCQRDEMPNREIGATTAPLQVNVGTQGITRAPVLGKWFANGAQINIILLDKETITTTYNTEMPYVLDRADEATAGVWSPAASTSLQVRTDVAKVSAHHPAEEQVTLSADKLTITATTPTTLDLGANNVSVLYESSQIVLDPAKPADVMEIFSAKADVDYMTGVGNEVSTTPGYPQTTTIEMKHSKAMVIVHLFKEAAYTGNENLTAITLRNDDAGGTKPLKSGTFTIADNSFVATVPDAPATYVRTMSAFPLGTRYAMMVYPADIKVGDVKLDFQVGAIKYKMAIGAMKWEAGKVYIYNIKLSASGLELNDAVGIYDWPAVKEHNVELE